MSHEGSKRKAEFRGETGEKAEVLGKKGGAVGTRREARKEQQEGSWQSRWV